MPFSQSNAFTPRTYDEVLQELIDATNAELGTSYNKESYEATNLYRINYPVIQLATNSEANTALIMEKLRNFFIDTNQRIIASKTTDEAIIEAIGALGFIASVRENEEADAGKLAVCVDIDPLSATYATDIINIAEEIIDNSFGGCWYDSGATPALVVDVVVVLSNGQSRTVSFRRPTVQDTMIRVTIKPSRNTNIVIDNEGQVIEKLQANLALFYKLGLDFEPEKYFEINRDAPYASDVLLEYSINAGSNWLSVPKENTFYYLMNFTDYEVIYDI